MLDTKVYVYNALKGNSALTTALGSATKIQYMYPNNFNALPIITYQENNNSNSEFYDDVSVADESTVEIHVWANTSTSTLSKLVNSVMVGLLYTRDYAGDVPEPDTKIFHKVLRYRRTLTADDLDAI
jgi:hypothetical protein